MPNKLLESDAPLAALESWLRKLIREEMEGFKAELKAYLDNPIGNDYMSLIGHDKQGTETDKEPARLDA